MWNVALVSRTHKNIQFLSRPLSTFPRAEKHAVSIRHYLWWRREEMREIDWRNGWNDLDFPPSLFLYMYIFILFVVSPPPSKALYIRYADKTALLTDTHDTFKTARVKATPGDKLTACCGLHRTVFPSTNPGSERCRGWTWSWAKRMQQNPPRKRTLAHDQPRQRPGENRCPITSRRK